MTKAMKIEDMITIEAAKSHARKFRAAMVMIWSYNTEYFSPYAGLIFFSFIQF